MTSRQYQHGMTMWAMLGVLLVVGFVALMAIRLVPVYIDYWSVASVAESVNEDSGRDDTLAEAWEKVRVRFDLNGIHDLEPRKVMNIKRKDNGLEIHVDYEQRKPLMANIDLVVTFDRTFGP